MSGIQHYCFCPRQWALIHIEQQWGENRLTAEGEVLHKRAHDPMADEKRGDRILSHGMPICSAKLGIRGFCDVVEFTRSESGVSITGREGKWLPVPVEYKHGDGDAKEADELQLCAQAICLEGMLCCDIPEGYLYYAEVRRRTKVPLTPELRARVMAMFEEMHRLYARGYTPRVKKRPGCKSCSLREICLPELEKTRAASAYLSDILRQTEDTAT
ncbi:MAG TPA: CRISPR-associated protein Cas4 [Clostridia bacterium]|nr:CRISPR-associated protein Cas4 [Clostridia bacterium]